ncbi:ABC-2 transporter permease [Sporolactobacillus laevolacticus]|uniref:ABC-2 transporter permease n=1 Tax=Sporolactobacillus laevolacticus TaxID=33018 RepID=UPI0025B61D2C|nr:ABC-2 transporter permease [Sporolactobacillus laevolacticus]MDN3956851.1 ABC-2 transporter permease [Sporolactobacillus laevolacticus]
MLQLMMKDFRIQNKKIVIVLVIMAIFMQMSIERDSFIKVGIILALIASLMSINANFNSRQTSDGDQLNLLLSLPIKRKQIIAATYLMIGVWYLIGYILFCITDLLITFTIQRKSSVDNPFIDVRTFVFGFCLTLILLSIYYVSYYRFNYKSVQMTTQIIWASFMAFVPWMKLDPQLDSNQMSLEIILLIALLVLVIVPITYWRTVQCFKQKDI